MNNLFDLLKEKPELENSIKEIKSLDDLFVLVSKEIPNYTKEKLSEDLKFLSEKKNGLSDDELESVSGGAEYKNVSDDAFLDKMLDVFDALLGFL